MPFKSEKQRKFLYSQHPEIAKRWRSEAGPQKNLPTYAPKMKDIIRKKKGRNI